VARTVTRAKELAFLAPYGFDLVFLDMRGSHPNALLQETLRHTSVAGKHILALGCRDGRETGKWLAARASHVTGLDYFVHQSWNHKTPGGSLTFVSGDVRCLPIKDSCVDLAVSESLMEHVSDPGAAFREIYRALKPGGLAVAIFGPLYYSYGGAHYEGAYEHVEYSPLQFRQFIEARNRKIEREECLFYLDNDMFSYWTAEQYLASINRFERIQTAVTLSTAGLAYRHQHPTAWKRLSSRVTEADLLIAGLALWLEKPRCSAT
jgi:ubiquinone/menaquinone biosynthesis C-methylase UbiE